MAGEEFVGAAKAAGAVVAAGQQALSDEPQRKQLRELAGDTLAMQTAADAYAQRILAKQAIMLKLWSPIGRMLGVSKAYFESDFAADLAGKLTTVADEDLVPPKPSVAVPAMEGLAYSLDEPALKEMYLNLLASASNGRRSVAAHPSFAQIIKELTGEEATLLDSCLRSGKMPIVRIKRTTTVGEHPGFAILQSHVLNCCNLLTGEPVEDDNLAGFVDN